MRNEMIDLLDDAMFDWDDVISECQENGELPPDSFVEHIADHLLSNGVTIAKDNNVPTKWIPVEERLPENGDDVLCWYEYFRYGEYDCMFQKHGIGFCINGNWGGEVMVGTDCRVIAWMPLPEPPKEEV